MIASNQNGFTLTEMLLSVVIIGMLVGLSLPFYRSFQSRADADTTAESITNMLRRGQAYARGMQGDSTWSVRIQSTSATLYKGATFASRDTTLDETTPIPTAITVTGLTDITFSKLSATPSTTGNITLTATSNDIRTITLNAEGMVSY
jgi:prepilin-type N-terminal cleavage/methylation domain-containing protein